MEAVDLSEQPAIARDDETLRDGRLALHQRQGHFTRGKPNLVINVVLRHEVAHSLSCGVRILSRQSDKFDTLRLKLFM